MPRYCELPHSGLIGLSGPDARTFLHSQLTCDVNALAPGRCTYGSYCTPKGRVLATFLLWRSGDGYYLRLPAPLRESIQKRLSMYLLRAKAKIEDAGPLWRVVGLHGEDAGDHVRRALGAAPQSDMEVASTADSMIIRLAAHRYEILLSHDGEPAQLERLKQGTESVSPAHWDWLDIRAGIPTITAPTQEQFVPQMVNLDLIGGLSFSKGCYPGQEIVARTHFLGRLKQRMFLAHLAAGEPRPGDKLYSPDLGNQASGMIVNATPAPEGGFDALAAIQIASAKSGVVRWKSPDGAAFELLPMLYEVMIEA